MNTSLRAIRRWVFAAAFSTVLVTPYLHAEDSPKVRAEGDAKSPAVSTPNEEAGSQSAHSIDANALMKLAHESRYVWPNFPGFQAEIQVESDGVLQKGKIVVASDLGYEVQLDEGSKPEWLESKLESIIGHRKFSGTGHSPVHLRENGVGTDGSVWVSNDDGSGDFHLANGRIAEVVRKSDSRWFEITNVDVLDAGNAKYLPTFTSVTYRNPQTGDLTENKSNHFTWVKKGDFLLPEHCFTVVTSANGGRQIQRLDFLAHELTKPTADNSNVSEFSSEPKFHRPLLEPLASFGASVLGDYLYVFSGHKGDAHGFGKDMLVNHFRRIKLDDPNAEWEELAMHDAAQSAALLNDGHYLYRIGGLTYRNNSETGKADFDSTKFFSRYDLETNQWTELPELPEGRSSLDAAILGRKIYVAGGWNLQGASSSSTPWHDKALVFDLDAPEKGWVEFDGPGYNFRAISAAAHNGKLYFIGGIQNRGFSRKTAIYDPESNSWSEGPEIPADSQTAGFATSSFAVDGHLYFTGGSGILYRLSEDGSQWEIADRLLVPRMFLRLLPVGSDRLVAVGGTNSSGSGRLASIESLKVSPKKTPAPKQVQWSIPYAGKAKHSQALVLDGYKLYAFGGNASWAPHDFSPESFVNEAYAFDLVTGKSEALPNLPRALQSASAVINRQTSEHKSIALLGGLGMRNDKFDSLDDVLSFDVDSKTWAISEVKLPTVRGMHDAVAKNEAIWIFGGSDSGNRSKLDGTVLHWWGDESAIAPLPNVSVPKPRRSFGGAVIGNEYFMVGGLGEGSAIVNEVDVFDFDKRTWRTVKSPNVSRVFPSLCSHGNKLYLYGGFARVDGHFAECSKLEIYDSERDEWTIASEQIPGTHASMKMMNLSGRLLFFGVDREKEGQTNFVLFDPSPTATPDQVSPMSFGGRERGGQSDANAKRMMRQDLDKDGKLNKEELGSRFADFLVKADKNNDELLDFDEVKAALDAEEAASPNEGSSERRGGRGRGRRTRENAEANANESNSSETSQQPADVQAEADSAKKAVETATTASGS